MRNIFLTTTGNRFGVFRYVKVLFLFLLISACFASSLSASVVGQASLPDIINPPYSQGIMNGVMTSGDACPTQEALISKTRTLQMPFIANNGQVDEQVRFYAKTFGGTVFVTKEGEIVYSLPFGRDVPAGASQESGRGHEAWGQGSRGAEEQGGKVVSGRYGQAPLVRAESELVVAYAYLPLLHADNANCPPDRVFAKSLIAAYLPGLLVETTRRVVCPSSMPPNYHPHSSIRGVALKETLLGAKIGGITGEQPAVTTVNYFTGNDKSKWKTHVPTYNIVSLGEVYKGIELRLKVYGDNVEKLFCVKPGVNPELIKVQLDGSKSLRVNPDGQLEADTELGLVKFTRPIAYQEMEGKRVEVAVEYSIHGAAINGQESRGAREQGGREEHETQNSKPETRNSKRTYGFTVASYDKTKDLIIDPLLASTFLGGSKADECSAIAIDSEGNAYVTGVTYSSNLPATSGAYDTSFNGGSDVFVSKFNGDLTSLLASTYLGGRDADFSNSIAIDSTGNVYLTGWTYSSNFPTTTGAYDTLFNKDSDVFVSKLNKMLTNLLASTYLGGSDKDFGKSLAINKDGIIYLTGYTDSSDFPTTASAFDTSKNGNTDAFVSKLNGTLTNLLRSTYLGGSNPDYGNAIIVPSEWEIVITGSTQSSDFPTTAGAYDTSLGVASDAFVTILDAIDLSAVFNSTYLGGSSSDFGASIARDWVGLCIMGGTYSSDFPTTTGAYDISYNGNKDRICDRRD
ncbi:MAG: SBBP repeat-containing protein [Planctomycetes bacterium]|nr:SBBP repeat-containing protein [Planctomycetota bacterium]